MITCEILLIVGKKGKKKKKPSCRSGHLRNPNVLVFFVNLFSFDVKPLGPYLDDTLNLR